MKGYSLVEVFYLMMGVVGIFCYVGVEVLIGSFLVNYFGEEYIVGFEEYVVVSLIVYYWGGVMVGCFIGFVVL